MSSSVPVVPKSPRGSAEWARLMLTMGLCHSRGTLSLGSPHLSRSFSKAAQPLPCGKALT